MNNRLNWIDNLRAIACIMVVMIHSTSYYVVTGLSVGEMNWSVANLLNSASRVCVPLFFMISGYLFFGEKSARKKHFLRITLCVLFYSLISLIYIAVFTRIGFWPSLKSLLLKPVFYHLWFFYAIIVIYLLSPLIAVKPASTGYLAAIVVILGVVANPHMVSLSWHGVHLLPVNLYVVGDTFYYLLYALMGRAIGMLDTERRGVSWAAALIFFATIIAIALSTHRQTLINGNFADTFYAYCGPLVFIAALSLFVWCKNCLTFTLPSLRLIAENSLAIYGFHAVIINFIRGHKLDFTLWPVLDIAYIFMTALLLSLLLSMGLHRLDRHRLVS